MLRISLSRKWRKTIINVRNAWQLYLLFLVPMAFIVIFHYLPMYGAQMAFRDFRITKGILGSDWVGLKHFRQFFHSAMFTRLMFNTLSISFYSLIAGYPFPIILALCLNNMRNHRYKKTVQMVTYAPYFISTVVMVGIMIQILDPRSGVIPSIIGDITGRDISNVLAIPEYFQSIYVWSGIWQNVGFNSILYLSVLSTVDPSQHEAAVVDGAGLFQRTLYIDLPAIIPTSIIILIMNTGHILNVGFEKVLLLQNPLNLRTSEVISTYVYKIGLSSSSLNYSYSAAIGLFSSVVGLIMIITVNKIAAKLGGTSLW